MCSQSDNAAALVQGFNPCSVLQAYNERLPSTWHVINYKVTTLVCGAPNCSVNCQSGPDSCLTALSSVAPLSLHECSF